MKDWQLREVLRAFLGKAKDHGSRNLAIFVSVTEIIRIYDREDHGTAEMFVISENDSKEAVRELTERACDKTVSKGKKRARR